MTPGIGMGTWTIRQVPRFGGFLQVGRQCVPGDSATSWDLIWGFQTLKDVWVSLSTQVPTYC